MSDSFLPEGGIIFVISSASGVGKSSICRTLIELDQNLSLSVSFTTRAPRKQERDGIDYHFTNKERFAVMLADGYFLEQTEAFGNFYGTPAVHTQSALDDGKDVLFDIDHNGTKRLKEIYPKKVVSIFILPPSFAELEKRIYLRNKDTSKDNLSRLKKSRQDLKNWKSYDYIVINDDFHKAIEQILCIITAERLKKSRSCSKVSTIVDMITK